MAAWSFSLRGQRGRVSLLLLIVAIGLVSFLVISSTFSFKTQLFSDLFPKSRTYAYDLSSVPEVDLKIIYQNKTTDGVINIPNHDSSIQLAWNVVGDAGSCVGKSYGIDDIDMSWNGPKDSKEGVFIVKNITNKNNAYIYSINCKNNQGDSAGDSITINIGANSNDLNPYITSLKAYQQNRELKNPIVIQKGKQFMVNWSSLNTASPYSICVSTGSFRTSYSSLNTADVSEELVLLDDKIHQFRIYCSNENSSTQGSIAIFPE